MYVCVDQIASDLPFHTYYVVLYVIPVYFMTNMPVDVVIFFEVRLMLSTSTLLGFLCSELHHCWISNVVNFSIVGFLM